VSKDPLFVFMMSLLVAPVLPILRIISTLPDNLTSEMTQFVIAFYGLSSGADCRRGRQWHRIDNLNSPVLLRLIVLTGMIPFLFPFFAFLDEKLLFHAKNDFIEA
jgi:hypothetical protein